MAAINSVILLALLAQPLPDARPGQSPPNIVFLLADDLGWTGLNCFGSDFYETPRLDTLASQGIRFTNAYSACTVCSPTRASILTGKYPARLHLTDFIAGQHRPYARLRIPHWTKRLKLSEWTIAESLRARGYTTIQVGKWHLAPRGPDAKKFQPTEHGFDRQVPRPRKARGYYLPDGFNSGASNSDYLTDYMTDQALEELDRIKNEDKPFFLYFAYHTPHTPIQGRKDLVEYFERKVDPNRTHHNPVYAAMVASLDQSVGRILDFLKAHQLERNTIVIFTSDNGGLTQRYGKHDGFTENVPLRRGKGSAYEGGTRVPAIVRWPAVTPPGSLCDAPVMSIDFFPTLAEISGAKIGGDVDGRSLAFLLKDPNARLPRDLFWHYPHYHAGGDSPYSAVRRGDWKLIEFHEANELALFNLSTDAGERNNLAAARPEVAGQLREALHTWRNRVGAQMPTANPDYDPERATVVKR